jgi:hypothetical protein
MFEPAVAGDHGASGIRFAEEIVEADLHGFEQYLAGLILERNSVPLAL